MTSETYRAQMDAICEDGKTRTAYVKCYRFDGSFAADTFSTVPAYVRVNGRYVSGFVGFRGDGRMSFTAYSSGKNHALVGG